MICMSHSGSNLTVPCTSCVGHAVFKIVCLDSEFRWHSIGCHSQHMFNIFCSRCWCATVKTTEHMCADRLCLYSGSKRQQLGLHSKILTIQGWIRRWLICTLKWKPFPSISVSRISLRTLGTHWNQIHLCLMAPQLWKYSKLQEHQNYCKLKFPNVPHPLWNWQISPGTDAQSI